MSGIYILVTNKDYRVTYSKHYHSMFLDWNEEVFNYYLNGQIVKQEFDSSPVFLKEQDALDYALSLADKYPETDDGIFYIENAKDKSYKEITNG